jgi:aminopeptidase N
MSKSVKRLYRFIKPIKYTIDLDINDQKLIFSGEEEIIFEKLKNPTKRLTFHQKNLKISKVNVFKYDSNNNLQELKLSRINVHRKYDELRIHFDFLIYPGKYLIKISYSGIITEEMNGIYPSTYKFSGKKERIISTQFESHHAREVFVAIDEPEAKAIFQISLKTAKFNTILSNTPVFGRKVLNEQITTIFNPTPIMSSYLVAFVIGNFEHISTKTTNGINLSVFAPMGKKKQLQFASSVAKKCLEFYQEFFKIDYPLPKCDLVAIPDFASGAMENWGLITFREQSLLFSKEISSIQTKEYVANVIAHELTHQWFGNLVTMEWWSDLWLNESFASWMSYLAVDHLFPEWKVWDKFITDEQSQALAEDSLRNTHPIRVKISHPDEIRSIFDVISYEKGASIIAMLESFMGDDQFKKGITYYLKCHQYANANTDDLWSALEKNSTLPIKSFISNWINLPGFPKVELKYAKNTVHFSQKRFFVDKDNTSEQNIWYIPLISNKSDFKLKMLTKQNQSISYSIPENDYFMINLSKKSFIRTSYGKNLLNKIIANVQKLSLIDRYSLITDMYELTKAREFKIIDLLENLDKFLFDRELIIWEEFAGIVRNIRLIMSNQELSTLINGYVLNKTKKVLDYYGHTPKESDSYFDKQLRPLILALNDRAGNEEIKEWAYSQYQIDPTLGQITPDIRPVIYGSVARRNLVKDYDILLNLHNQSSDSELRSILASSLSIFKDPQKIKNNLELLKSTDIRLQDLILWINSLLYNKSARPLIWEWIKQNWEYLQMKIGNDLGFSRLPLYIARVFSSRALYEDYEHFFEDKSTPALQRSIGQGIETIKWHYKWVDQDFDTVFKFFKNNNL